MTPDANSTPTWHRISMQTLTRRTDPDLAADRRWLWRNVAGQLRLRSPHGRERVFQLGKRRPGAWVRRLKADEQAVNLENRKA